MDVQLLKSEYKKRKDEIKARLNEFKQQTNNFYELCFCLLTPQSNALKCDACITILKDKNFIENDFEISQILQKHTRFHNNKSNYLVQVKKNRQKIFEDLAAIKDSKAKRDYLVKNVKGLGLKEASHFLRNTGHKDLAILDRHILKNLALLGVIKEVPKSLTPKLYFEIEDKFMQFAKKIGIPMDELDLLFWSFETGKVFK